MTRAVVFGYHNVGVRCLRVLLAHGVDVPLVVTHHDQPDEAIWFESVARHAAWHGIPTVVSDDVNASDILERVQAVAPDFLFSFYYRQMLKPGLLALARRGAFNMHGSLLPRYRGRAPVNWAVLKGEPETGATLHVMEARADAGAIVDQQAVPILPDDTAFEVFQKVTVAAEMTLHRSVPALIAGVAKLRAQQLTEGSYFGRRTAADGIINWHDGARAAHNLIRAVAPPYPGAFSEADGFPLRIFRSLRSEQPCSPEPVLRWWRDGLWASCHDGAVHLLEFNLGGDVRSAEQFRDRFGDRILSLTTPKHINA